MIRMRRLAAFAAVTVGAWMVIAVLSAYQHHNIALLRGRDSSFTIELLEKFVGCLIFACVTPAVVYGALRIRNVFLLALFGLTMSWLRAEMSPMIYSWFHGFHPPWTLEWRIALTCQDALFFAGLIAATKYVDALREASRRRNTQAALLADLERARLQRLRADLDPHFLFNSLTAVAALLHADVAAAERMIRTLRELLERSFDWASSAEIALSEELDFLERYLEIQQTRFGERLRVEVDVDRDVRGASVPPLLLQPLVENAIVHGVARRTQPTRVSIRAHREAGRLHLEVRNTAAPEHASSTRRTIGLPNTAGRLQLLYGARQTFALRRDADDVIAVVTMPLAGVSA
ncbi:MAG TPA: histidine kinase [Thermoanaerobaculia bacterium]